MSANRMVRILHVVGKMNRGGVETWLMNVLRQIDRTKYQMDFLVHTEQNCAYDDEIRTLGSQIIPCMHPSQPLQYALNFRRILHEYGPYDVVHSHVHHFSGYVTFLAYLAGIPMRIAHSHSDTSRMQSQARLPRKAYLSIMEYLIRQFATNGIAASSEAGKALFVDGWGNDSRWQTIYYGISLDSFRDAVDKNKIRSELNIAEDAFVIGHVGNFNPVKNHKFIINIAIQAVKRDSNICFLLVGDGPLRPQIEALVRDAGLFGQVIFAGSRPDVPLLMLGAMDMFMMPSFYEGLPVAALEAQAAGLQCMLSDTISREVSVATDLITWNSLSKSAEEWANAILEIKAKKKAVQSSQHFSYLENSSFNIITSVNILSELYSK